MADVTAATGTPTPIANPALAAVDGVPRAAEVRPAPRSASAGRLSKASPKPRSGVASARTGPAGTATTVASTSRAPKITAAARAPRRATRIASSRRPVGSGRQLGSHGPIDQASAASTLASLAGLVLDWLPDERGGQVPYDAPVSASSNGSLRVERTGPAGVVARVTLSRPEVHNAFDASLIADLRTAFALLAREGPTELRAVVLAGDGPSFCAGADLAWMRAAMSLD